MSTTMSFGASGILFLAMACCTIDSNAFFIDKFTPDIYQYWLYISSGSTVCFNWTKPDFLQRERTRGCRVGFGSEGIGNAEIGIFPKFKTSISGSPEILQVCLSNNFISQIPVK